MDVVPLCYEITCDKREVPDEIGKIFGLLNLQDVNKHCLRSSLNHLKMSYWDMDVHSKYMVYQVYSFLLTTNERNQYIYYVHTTAFTMLTPYYFTMNEVAVFFE